MTDLQDVIGLLHRADWTRLSLSADVHSETDQDLWMSRVRATMPRNPWSAALALAMLALTWPVGVAYGVVGAAEGLRAWRGRR